MCPTAPLPIIHITSHLQSFILCLQLKFSLDSHFIKQNPLDIGCPPGVSTPYTPTEYNCVEIVLIMYMGLSLGRENNDARIRYARGLEMYEFIANGSMSFDHLCDLLFFSFIDTPQPPRLVNNNLTQQITIIGTMSCSRLSLDIPHTTETFMPVLAHVK